MAAGLLELDAAAFLPELRCRQWRQTHGTGEQQCGKRPGGKGAGPVG